MGTSPNRSWGTGAADAPPSFNDGWTPPVPAPDLGTNLALGRPVTASAPCAAAESAEKAVDGVLMNNSKWCSLAAGSWLQVDLGSNRTVGSFAIAHAGLGGENTAWNTGAYSLQTSTDGTTWVTRVNASGNQSSRTLHTIAAVTARYVRLNVLTPTTNGNTATRIYELEVYGGAPAGVVFYQDIDFGGAASGAYAAGDYPALPADVPNDWMSSLKVPGGWRVEAYSDGNFQGAVCTYTADTAWVGSGCNDVMSSFRIRAP
jgi:hypothetical protein